MSFPLPRLSATIVLEICHLVHQKRQYKAESEVHLAPLRAASRRYFGKHPKVRRLVYIVTKKPKQQAKVYHVGLLRKEQKYVSPPGKLLGWLGFNAVEIKARHQPWRLDARLISGLSH